VAQGTRLSDAWRNTNLSLGAYATDYDSYEIHYTAGNFHNCHTTNRSMKLGAKTFQHMQLARLARALHGTDVLRFRYYFDISFFLSNVSTSSRFPFGSLSSVQLRFTRPFFPLCSSHPRCFQRFPVSFGTFLLTRNDAAGVGTRDKGICDRMHIQKGLWSAVCL